MPLSVRVSDEDAVFLANLEIGDAVTPSEKLRALLQGARRQQAGMHDAAEGGLILRDMAMPAWRAVRRIEAQAGRKSDLILKLYERVPDLMARLIAGPGDDEPERLAVFEADLLEQICLLLKDFISLGLTSPVHVHSATNFDAEMKPVMDLVELARHHRKIAKGEHNE